MCSPSLVFFDRNFARIFFAVCPCIRVLVTQHQRKPYNEWPSNQDITLKEDTVKLYLQTKSSKMLEILGSGFSLKGLTK